MDQAKARFNTANKPAEKPAARHYTHARAADRNVGDTPPEIPHSQSHAPLGRVGFPRDPCKDVARFLVLWSWLLYALEYQEGVERIPSGAAAFTTTHWSVVLAAGDSSEPSAQAALEQLCRAYWFPLYAFVRRLGNAPEQAQDLTQGYFAHLLERRLVTRADPEMGRFRSFLLASLRHFLAHEHERATALKRGGGQVVSFDAFDPEERYALEPADTASPEMIFDQRWAQQQIENALNRLRSEYASAGRGPLFDLLKDYVWGDKNALSLGEIAGQLDLTEEAVKKSVQRLRQRFRESLRTEVAQTVASPDQIDDELRHLRAALSLDR